jgi:hypothetical protein
VIGTYNCHGWQWDTRLASKHSLHHFPFTFLFFGHKPQLPTSIYIDVAKVVNLDYPNVWVLAYEQCVVFFKRVMPMAMENLAIVQH